MFCDWSHMTLDEEVMRQMQDIYKQKFEDSIYEKVPGDILPDNVE